MPMKRTQTDYIVVHCSATRASQDFTARDIRLWHIGNGWRDIGYHFVITRSGAIQHGRAIEDQGAHVRGHNGASVGVCLIGGVDENNEPENNFTPQQLLSLRLLIDALKLRYPGAKLMGHRDFPEVAKACPSFDVRDWYRHSET